LSHTNRTGRPKHGRSANVTGGRSFTCAVDPQLEQRGRGARHRLPDDIDDGG